MTLLMTTEIQTFRKGNCEFDRVLTVNPLKSVSLKYFVWILSKRSDSCFWQRLSDDYFLTETSLAIC